VWVFRGALASKAICAHTPSIAEKRTRNQQRYRAERVDMHACA
jgi:hypothetical protein